VNVLSYASFKKERWLMLRMARKVAFVGTPDQLAGWINVSGQNVKLLQVVQLNTKTPQGHAATTIAIIYDE